MANSKLVKYMYRYLFMHESVGNPDSNKLTSWIPYNKTKVKKKYIQMIDACASKGLHMGPKILCYFMLHFLFCPYVVMSCFIRL